MSDSAKAKVLFSGLLFLVVFIYINGLLFVASLQPDQDNQYELRSGPQFIKIGSSAAWKTLACLTFPAWILSQLIYEPYFGELVYYPLLGGIMWFGYGCFIRWAISKKRAKQFIFMLCILWAVLLYLGLAKNLFQL
jgi:hypothetical protein